MGEYLTYRITVVNHSPQFTVIENWFEVSNTVNRLLFDSLSLSKKETDFIIQSTKSVCRIKVSTKNRRK